MFSLFVVALFFLMILTPCLIALRSRWEDTREPGEGILSLPTTTTDASSDVVEASLDSIAALEYEVLVARRAMAMVESDLLAAEARLAMARAKQAAEQAALASRAASQAAEAAVAATEAVRAEARAAAAEARPARTADTRPADMLTDGSVLPETHPSMDFPRSRVSRRAA